MTLAQEVTPYITTAVGAYGAAVLTRAEDTAADATVNFAKRVLERVIHRGTRTPDGVHPIAAAVSDLAAAPEDTDLQAVLRLEIRRALQADPQLLAELAALPRPATSPGQVTVQASGERAVAVQHNSGTITTGDTQHEPPR